MLNFIYYPVSFILWCWHAAFAFILGGASATGWALAIVLLVFTLRAVLLKPSIRQTRSMLALQSLAPQVKAIQQKYANDRPRQMAEIQKLHRRHGVSPLGGFLPVILQVPVFVGLNHVLRTFTKFPDRPNYFFPLSSVHSYLAADLFGAHLGDAIVNFGLFAGSAAHHATWAWGVAPVAIPLMICAAVATHFTARISAKRSAAAGATGTRQQQVMSMIAMWVFPLGALVFGGALPVGLLVYWVSNNVWTFGQQHIVSKRIAREQAETDRRAQEARRARTPKPGQKPGQKREREEPGHKLQREEPGQRPQREKPERAKPEREKPGHKPECEKPGRRSPAHTPVAAPTERR